MNVKTYYALQFDGDERYLPWYTLLLDAFSGHIVELNDKQVADKFGIKTGLYEVYAVNSWMVADNGLPPRRFELILRQPSCEKEKSQKPTPFRKILEFVEMAEAAARATASQPIL